MTMRPILVAGVCWLTAGAALGQGSEPVIGNSLLEVRFDKNSSQFSILAKPSRETFVREGALNSEPGTAKIEVAWNETFGRGQEIRITHAGGNREEIMVFPDLPFALFRSALHNPGHDIVVKQKVPTLSALVDLGHPAAELKTLGTGGLLGVGENPGSYAWLTVVEPRGRNGVVCGWLTEDRGSGVVFSKVDNGRPRLKAQIDYGRLRLKPGATEALETFAIGYFEDARLGLEQWADGLAAVYHVKLPPQPAGYCTWYSRPYGAASDEEHLAELAGFAVTNLAPFGFSVVQIDDHWQAGMSTNGPNRNFTTHAPNGPYPHGMKAAADKIKALGLTPGIWFMPFAGTYYDPFFTNHMDWFVKRDNGKPYETKWGGTSLDMTEAGARAHLRSTAHRISQTWGFNYFKVDGLWTGTATRQVYPNDGYLDDGIGDAVFHNPDKTDIEAYRDGLKLLRKAAGDKVFILGCNGPQNMRSYGGAFGLVDAMRIGPDNSAEWERLLRGPTFGSRHYFLHGRVWYNDPDPVYVRTTIPLNHAQLICTWVAISGQMDLSSEWLPGLPPDRLDILKRTMPNHGLHPRPVDLFDEPIPCAWLLTDERHSPRRDVVGLFNWDDTEKTLDYSLDRIGLNGGTEYVGFDYWQNKLVGPFKDRLRMTLPPESCCSLAVRPRLDRPQLLSTSRHITQGIVDVIEETWDDTAKVLSGRSRVVGGDPYELRVVAMAPGTGWVAESLEVSPKDQGAKVQTGLKQEGELVRARIDSPESREVSWRIQFHAGDHARTSAAQ